MKAQFNKQYIKKRIPAVLKVTGRTFRLVENLNPVLNRRIYDDGSVFAVPDFSDETGIYMRN